MHILPFKRSQVKAVFGSTTCSAAGCVNTLVKCRAVSHQQGFVGAFYRSAGVFIAQPMCAGMRPRRIKEPASPYCHS